MMEILDEQLLKNIKIKLEEFQSIAKKENVSLNFYITAQNIKLHIIKYIKTPCDIFKPVKVETLSENRIKLGDTYEVLYSVITSKNM